MTDTIAVTVNDAASRLGVSPEIVRAAINRGELPARRVPSRDGGGPGNSMRIDVEDLRSWFDSWSEARSPNR